MIGVLSCLAGLVAAAGAATAVVALGGDDDPGVDIHFTADDADGAGTDATPLIGLDTDGATVPGTRYELLAGGLGSLRDHRGTPMVVNFFGSWCVPCRDEMPAFEAVHDDLGDRVAFVGIAFRDGADAARALVRQTGVTYETGRDPTGKIAEALDILKFPTTLLVDAEGRVVSTHPGELTARQLRALIDDHLL